MASINGISIKNVKTFRDHEGAQIAQANVYLNNKKIGFWSQDAWGGADMYEGCESEIQKAADSFTAGYPKGKRFSAYQNMPDVFMGHLLALTEDEKEYKKMVKNGYPNVCFATDGFHYKCWGYAHEGDMNKNLPTIAKQVEKEMFNDVCVKIYTATDISDFTVVVNDNNPAPDYMVDD